MDGMGGGFVCAGARLWKRVCESVCSSLSGLRTISDMDDGGGLIWREGTMGMEGIWEVLGIMGVAPSMLGVAWTIGEAIMGVAIVAAVQAGRTRWPLIFILEKES